MLALLVVMLLIDHRGYRRGLHKRDGEMATLTARATEAEASVFRLRASIDDQNAAVAALKTEADARTKQGQTALKQAHERTEALSGAIAGLRASAGKVRAVGAPCEVSGAVKAAEGRL